MFIILSSFTLPDLIKVAFELNVNIIFATYRFFMAVLQAKNLVAPKLFPKKRIVPV
jgi:hypothetical protein